MSHTINALASTQLITPRQLFVAANAHGTEAPQPSVSSPPQCFFSVGGLFLMTTGTAVSLFTLSTFQRSAYVVLSSLIGSAYHLLTSSPESLIHTNSDPHWSKPVVVIVVLASAVNPTASNDPELLSMYSFGEDQFPLTTAEAFTGEAVRDPSSAFCVTTEF